VPGTLSMPAILCIWSGNVSTDCQLHIDNPSDNSLHFRNECWLLYIVISLDSNLSTDRPNLFIHMKECCLLPILSIHPHERVLFVANFVNAGNFTFSPLPNNAMAKHCLLREVWLSRWASNLLWAKRFHPHN